MSKGNVDKFLDLMQKDEGLARKMAACLYKLETNDGKADGSGDFISKEIVPLAKEYGLEFTAQDFLDYTEEAKAKVGLTAEDLAEVSGGKGGVRAALMGTLALLGVAAAPAAMEMVSGGEVAPFSMVASAAEDATPDQIEELRLGLAGLKSLKKTIANSALDNKNDLEKERDQLVNSAVRCVNSKNKSAIDKMLKNIDVFIKKVTTAGLSNYWFEAKKQVDNLSGQVENLMKNQLLDQTQIKGIKTDIQALKNILIYSKSQTGKEKKATELEIQIKSFENIIARAEKLNKNKEQLVQNLHNIKSRLSYNEGKKIDEQISALNDEIKDFTPENIQAKEEAFNAIKILSNTIIDIHDLQKDVAESLKTKGANQDRLNGIKNTLDIAAGNLTKENVEDTSKVLTEIKEKLKTEKENIEKIKAESKKQKEQQQKEASEHVMKISLEINSLQKEVETLLENKHANKEDLNDIKATLDNAAGNLTRENVADISNALTEIKEKLKAEKENIEKIKAESKKQKQKEQEEKDKQADENHKLADGVKFFGNVKVKVKNNLPTLKKGLDILENYVVDLQKRTDAAAVQESIKKLRERIDNFGDVTYENATDKANKLKKLEEDVTNLILLQYTQFEEKTASMSEEKKIRPKFLRSLKAFMKKDKTAVKEIEKLEKELATIPEERPRSQQELNERAAKLKTIRESIPQIKAALNKATTLKKIAEQVDNRFTEIFDNIIKEIEAADSVEKFKTAETKIDNAEKTLRSLMRTKINEANKTAHLLHEIAKIFGLNQLKGNFLNLIDTFDRFNYDGAPIAELYNVYNHVETVNIVENELRERLGKQTATLIKEQATKLKGLATGVDDYLVNAFDGLVKSLSEIKLNGDLQEITTDFNQVKNLVNERAKELAEKLKLSEEIDELLKNEVMGAEIQDELKAIKAGLLKADEANADTVVKAFDDVKAVKTKMANKLLEWHKVLSEYHAKSYHKEGVEEVESVVETNLETLKGGADKMLAGANEVKLNAKNLNEFTEIALKIAGNLNTDIGSVIDTVKGYKGFRTTGLRLVGGIRLGDYTASWQAHTLVTFLRDSVVDMNDLKFVDEKTRTNLAADLKHIFDQIKIDQKTGKYYLPGFYNWGAVNHDDLKLICEAYDVVADDFAANESKKRSTYNSFEILGATTLPLKDKAETLIGALANVQRLNLLDVSPESREALKKDILEIGAKIKSTPGLIYGRTLSLEGVNKTETKNMQDGLARILEFYNYQKIGN